jgi:hypothetical protein
MLLVAAGLLGAVVTERPPSLGGLCSSTECFSNGFRVFSSCANTSVVNRNSPSTAMQDRASLLDTYLEQLHINF